MLVNQEEIWKDIDGFPNYQVSNTGKVRSSYNNKYGTGNSYHELRPGLGGVGYLTVTLYKDNKATTKNVHDLVITAFLSKRKDGMIVNHKDGDKTNNNISNLEWVTYRENLMHAYDTGLNNHKQPVRIVETGEVFDSLKECANAIDGYHSDIGHCLNGFLKTHRGLHFEKVNKESIKPKKEPFLRDYQMDAVKKMANGKILNGGVGSGKSRTGLYYYFSKNGGSIDENGYNPMTHKQDLVIITTALKRDNLEWVGELANYCLSTDSKNNGLNLCVDIKIDSWNNVKKYVDVHGAMFIFDEDHLTGSGAWVKAFYKIAKNNDWIILSATPGDTYEQYIPVFVANGFFKNKSEFIQDHVVYARYTKFPKIDRYLNTRKLDRLRDNLLVDMDFQRETVHHDEDVYCKYDVAKYKEAMKNRWDPFKQEPIQNASGLCHVLRRIVNIDDSRVVALMEILEKHPRAIIFYNYNFELEMLRYIFSNMNIRDDDLNGFEVAEWNSSAHQPIPKGDRWVYLCQFNACEGWNCITTDTIIFFSQNYSYKIMAQAAGRIDRLNTPYTDLYYYHLKSRSSIDLAISKAIHQKKKFNERKFTKWD